MAKKKKAEKPYEGFPLYEHVSGRYAKTIRGKTCYFGPVGDWRKALDRFIAERDELYAGRKPKPKVASGHTIADCVNQFLADREALLKTGEIVKRTWDDYVETCKGILAHFGRSRFAEDLTPTDFAGFREVLAKGRTVNSLGNEIGRVRAVFNHVGPKGIGWLETPVRYGGMFKRPDSKTLQVYFASKPSHEIPPEVIRQTVGLASDQVSAMILLGINCGLGNNDCARLESIHLQQEDGWLIYPRPKTGVKRRAKLWPETVASLEKLEYGDRQLVFVTRFGNAWAGKGRSNPISAEFKKLLRIIGEHAEGRAFYSLRRTFQTVAEECGDFPAISLVMGHDDHSMASRYRQRISDERLTRVSETVRSWLLASQVSLG